MNAFPIGISALGAGRRALEILGQNIANAATPGYHRQAVNLVSNTLDGVHGIGVDVASITRYSSPPMRTAILRGNADLALAAERLAVRRQIEGLLADSSGGLSAPLENFFNQLERISSRPEETAARRPALTAASDLAVRLNTVASDLDRLRRDVGARAVQSVQEINDLASRIAELNVRIAGVEQQGDQANDLRDRRDQLIDDLSRRITVRPVEQPYGMVNVMTTGAAVVVGESATQFQIGPDVTGNLVVTESGAASPLTFEGGSLAGTLQEHNQELPATRARLDGLARALIRRVNQVQATGLGVTGPLTLVRGTQSVADPTAPLASQNLPFPLQAGELVVTVTDVMGNRTNAVVAIDPATQSLQDVAAAITSATGGQVQGSVEVGTNALRLEAQPGSRFDFGGRLPSTPDAVNMGGTAVPRVGGVYTGTTNDVYSFQITGSGTVGVTPGLTLEVRDSANNVIAALNVGADYAPGTPLVVANGITVQLAPGTTTNGSFSAPMIARPDTAGLLSGLGVNGLFEGSDAASIAVRSVLVKDPGLLSASRTGQPGDSRNLERFAAIRGELLFGGTRTLAGEITDISASVGAEVHSLDDQETAQAGLLRTLSAQEQAVAGVDVNEELVHLMNYQRMVEGASRYLAVVNSTLDSLLEIVR